MEERKKRIVIGITAAAVVLLAILIVFWVYQMIAIGARRAREAELTAAIEALEEENKDLEAESDKVQNNLVWLENMAGELGMRY